MGEKDRGLGMKRSVLVIGISLLVSLFYFGCGGGGEEGSSVGNLQGTWLGVIDDLSGTLQEFSLQVDSDGDYARLMHLINQQNGVSRVSVKQVRADELMLDVWVSGGVESLGNSLPLSGELIPVTDVQQVGEAQVHELSYRLNH